jgi:hypothetical protein
MAYIDKHVALISSDLLQLQRTLQNCDTQIGDPVTVLTVT